MWRLKASSLVLKINCSCWQKISFYFLNFVLGDHEVPIIRYQTFGKQEGCVCPLPFSTGDSWFFWFESPLWFLRYHSSHTFLFLTRIGFIQIQFGFKKLLWFLPWGLIVKVGILTCSKFLYRTESVLSSLLKSD